MHADMVSHQRQNVCEKPASRHSGKVTVNTHLETARFDVLRVGEQASGVSEDCATLRSTREVSRPRARVTSKY